MRSKLFKACLLLGVMSVYIPQVGAASGGAGDKPPVKDFMDLLEPAVLPVRQKLLEVDMSDADSSYLTHQRASIEFQHKLRSLRARLDAEVKGTAKTDIAARKVKVRADIAALVPMAVRAERKDELTNAERESARSAIGERMRRNEDDLIRATDAKAGHEIIAGLQLQREALLYELDLLNKRPWEILEEKRKAEELLKQLEREESESAAHVFEDLIKLAALKLKTIYNLVPQKSKMNLYTRKSKHLDRMKERYSDLVAWEEDNTVSMFKDVVQMLHGLGTGRELVCGVTVTRGDDGDSDAEMSTESDRLNIQRLLLHLVGAIETPAVDFKTSDLPRTHNMQHSSTGQYVAITEKPRNYLDAYAYMAEHVASVFDMRLREDVASLRTIVDNGLPFNSGNTLGQTEDPSVLATTGIWAETAGVIGEMWGVHSTAGQAAFVEVVKTYDPSFDLTGNEAVLTAAIPPNPLGMIYRLAQAAESDIHSWNPTDQYDLDARLAQKRVTSSDVGDEFLDSVRRIVGRHFNKLILDRIAKNVGKLSATPRPAVLTAAASGSGSSLPPAAPVAAPASDDPYNGIFM